MVLRAESRRRFALAGGNALIAHGIVDRLPRTSSSAHISIIGSISWPTGMPPGYPVSVTTARTAQAAVRVAPYLARPGRRVLVALKLADLRGPVRGPVEVPLRLLGSRPEDLTAFLNGDALVDLWPRLFVPKGVRQAWEDDHPVLRTAAAAAA